MNETRPEIQVWVEQRGAIFHVLVAGRIEADFEIACYADADEAEMMADLHADILHRLYNPPRP